MKSRQIPMYVIGCIVIAVIMTVILPSSANASNAVSDLKLSKIYGAGCGFCVRSHHCECAATYGSCDEDPNDGTCKKESSECGSSAGQGPDEYCALTSSGECTAESTQCDLITIFTCTTYGTPGNYECQCLGLNQAWCLGGSQCQLAKDS